jgi:hypothetical protein
VRRFLGYPRVRMRLPSGAAHELHVADGSFARLNGLAGLAGLPAGRGLLIPRCSCIHTLGMRFAIDVVFVSWPPVLGRSRVLAVREQIGPSRLAWLRREEGGSRRRGVGAVELAAGDAARLGVRPGEELVIVRLSSTPSSRWRWPTCFRKSLKITVNRSFAQRAALRGK